MRTVTVYNYDELSAPAKQRARDNWRADYPGDDWRVGVYEDVARCLKIAGFEIETAHNQLQIYFTLHVQGAGACFEGGWAADPFNLHEITSAHEKAALTETMRDHAPQDKELHQIYDEMLAIAFEAPDVTATIKRHGRGTHEHSVTIEVNNLDGLSGTVAINIEDRIIDTTRRAMRWIHRQLDQEYDYLTSDEALEEFLKNNEVEFDEHGRRWPR
jgi:hypothetical protein